MDRSLTKLALVALALWAALHAIHFDRFIFHDSWKYIFPLVYRVAASGSCLDLPAWLGTVDNGSATSVYALSASFTHLLRIPELYLLSCLDISPRAAVYVHKLQIFVSWALLALGMYALGRVLFRHRVSAIYLFVASLFAGASLDASHSDQIVSELFWIPWLTAAFALWHERVDRDDSPLYFNIGALLFGVALLDHYPHLPALGAGVAAVIYVSLHPALTIAFLKRNWLRLWPSAVVLAVAVVQLLIVKNAIADYSPSLRADLTVDPEKFGTTGFLQPTAIVALFFPLTFFVDYDKLFITLQQYIFKLDLLLFYFGAVPLLLVYAAFLSKQTTRAAKFGWGIFALAILAIALQQSRLYYLVFHLPFFDVFRGYFLFSMLLVFAFLVLGGYGFDALVMAKPEERRVLARKAAFWFLVSAGAVALLLAWLTYLVPFQLETVKRMIVPFAIDLIALVGAVWISTRAATLASAEAWSRHVLIALVLLQVPFTLGAYGMLASSGDKMFREYGLQAADVTPDPNRNAGSGVVRTLCTKYAQCYLSTHRTVSLNLDLEGTFLRHKDEPVFQAGLSRRAQEMLIGLTHPDVWLSRRIAASPDRGWLLSDMNESAAPGGSGLSDYTVSFADNIPFAPAREIGQILRIVRGPDRIAVTYLASEPQILNLAVNFDPAWRARVGNRVLAPMKVNFGGMAVHVPAGEREVVFEYRNPPSELFFLSRYVLVLLALLSATFLLIQSRRREISP